MLDNPIDNPICPKCHGWSLSSFLPSCSLCGGAGRVEIDKALEYLEKILPKPRELTAAEKEKLASMEALTERGGYWTGGPRGLPRWVPYRDKNERS